MKINLLESGRVLYISSVDISIGNGPGVNEREFVLELSKAIGDRAHFIIPQQDNVINEIPLNYCTFTKSHRGHHPLHYILHIFSVLIKTAKILSSSKFDLVVFRLDVLPVAPLILMKKYKIPYAVKTLGQGSIKVLHEKGWILGKMLRSMNLWMFKKLVRNGLVADCDSTNHVEYMKKTLRVNSDKVVWIDNAVNTNRFFPESKFEARKRFGLDNLNPVIGYIGTRPWERGAKQIIEVAPSLLEKYPNLGLIVLGNGKEVKSLKKLVADLNMTSRCKFLGYVPFDQVPHYINCLDVGVSISYREDRKNNAELKVRQYLACGKPVIVSPGSNDFVDAEKFGSIVQPTDLDTIKSEIDRWLSVSDEHRNQFSLRAFHYMENKLSMKVAINRRLQIWTDRLANNNNKIKETQ